MYVYIKSERGEPGLWTVGHYEPGDNAWIPESDHRQEQQAAARCNYLNGGSAPPDNLILALRGLLAKSNGRLGANPYLVPEFVLALKALKDATQFPGKWQDANKEYYRNWKEAQE